MPENNQTQEGYPQPTQGMPQQPMGQPYGQPEMPMPEQGGMIPPQEMPQYGMPTQEMAPQKQKKGLGGGAVAAIVVATLAVGLLIGFLIFGVLGKKDSTDTPTDTETTSTQTADNTTSSTSGTTASMTSQPASTETSAPAGAEALAESAPAAPQDEQAAPAAEPVAADAPASNDWLSGEFVLDGQQFFLMQSGFHDLENAGWHLNEQSQDMINSEYGGTYMLNANKNSTGLFMRKDSKAGVAICTVNLSNSAQDFSEGLLSSISVTQQGSYSNRETPSFIVAGGGALGMTIDEITALYGEPSSTSVSSDSATYRYEPRGDMYKKLVFYFNNGVVYEIDYRLG